MHLRVEIGTDDQIAFAVLLQKDIIIEFESQTRGKTPSCRPQQ